MFARPSTGPVIFGQTARSRRRLMAACSARSLAARLRWLWLKGLSSWSVSHLVGVTSYQTVVLLSGMLVDTHNRPRETGNEMPPTNPTERLADYEKRYRELAAQLATIGLIHSGSVTRRYTRCGTPRRQSHTQAPPPPRPPPHRP